MRKIIGIIPARSGSVGIKNKNIATVCGFPLIAYSICAAKLCKYIDRVIVSTDSEQYANIAKEFGAEIPFLRPSEISGSKSLDIEYLEYTLGELSHREGEMPEYIVLLRPTTPIRDPLFIDKAVEMMLTQKDASAIVSISPVTDCAFKWAILNEDGYLRSPFESMNFDDVNLPRQSFPPLYYPDGYVDVIRASEILNHHRMYGNNALPFWTKMDVVDIDKMEDLEKITHNGLVEDNEIYNYLNNHYASRKNLYSL